MFNFFLDANNYEERKVDRFENGDIIIDTCAVSDGKQPYETAIAHPSYNNGKWIVVEAYSTKKSAQTGHNKWVKIITSKKLPSTLADCRNALIAGLIDEEYLIFKKKE